MISKKVILTGSFGVGKTSLFNRFIFSRFSDKYLTTIGVKVNKKTLNINGRELSMLVWDIAGEVSQDKVPTSYFLGASGVLYVFDLTRPSTFANIKTDLEYLNKVIPDTIIKVVGNKMDLVSAEELTGIKANIQHPWDILTSAKTGDHVEELFNELGVSLLNTVE